MWEPGDVAVCIKELKGLGCPAPKLEGEYVVVRVEEVCLNWSFNIFNMPIGPIGTETAVSLVLSGIPGWYGVIDGWWEGFFEKKPPPQEVKQEIYEEVFKVRELENV